MDLPRQAREIRSSQLPVIALMERGILLLTIVLLISGWPADALAKNTYRPKTSHIYITGKRGGCYYINKNGNKTYVDRDLCK